MWPGWLPTHLHVVTGTGLDAAGAAEPAGTVGHLHLGSTLAMEQGMRRETFILCQEGAKEQQLEEF